jgi:hypothetical protein
MIYDVVVHTLFKFEKLCGRRAHTQARVSTINAGYQRSLTTPPTSEKAFTAIALPIFDRSTKRLLYVTARFMHCNVYPVAKHLEVLAKESFPNDLC